MRGLEPCVDVGINEQRVLELIRMNNRITAKEIAESLSVSLRQSERIMSTLKEKGLIKRVELNSSYTVVDIAEILYLYSLI